MSHWWSITSFKSTYKLINALFDWCISEPIHCSSAAEPWLRILEIVRSLFRVVPGGPFLWGGISSVWWLPVPNVPGLPLDFNWRTPSPFSVPLRRSVVVSKRLRCNGSDVIKSLRPATKRRRADALLSQSFWRIRSSTRDSLESISQNQAKRAWDLCWDRIGLEGRLDRRIWHGFWGCQF